MVMQARASESRLQAAIEAEELKGLRLAAFVRAPSMTMIAIWLGIQLPLSEAPFYWLLLLGFVLAGWLPYDHRRRGKRWRWPRYVYPLLDAVLLTFTVLIPNPLADISMPPPIFLRFGNEIYFFMLIASAVFYYQPRIVIWSGLCAALSWAAGTFWIAWLPTSRFFDNETYHQLSDIDAKIAYFLAPELVNLNDLGTQILVFLLVAGCLAMAVARFRALMVNHAHAERERSNLARYFSPNIVDELATIDEPFSAARAQNVAILFADIIGFTKLAETQSPEKVFALLRDILGLMARQVFLHEGTLDKYLGDGIMATFGTPHGNGHEADDALACAQAILDEIAAYNRERDRNGEPNVDIGIGLHFGPVVLGDVGDESRLEFAVVGDTVNVASRFERLTRELGVNLVVSDDLISVLSDKAQNLKDDLNQGSSQQIRGRDQTVPVWTM